MYKQRADQTSCSSTRRHDHGGAWGPCSTSESHVVLSVAAALLPAAMVFPALSHPMHTKADPGVLVGDSAHCSFSTFNFISLDTNPRLITAIPHHPRTAIIPGRSVPSLLPTTSYKTIASEAVECHHGLQGRAEEGESRVAVMDHHTGDLG